MRRPLRAAVFVVTLGAASAFGCGGGELFEGRWSLDRRDYSGVYGLPFLSPANDSRLNLRLLMQELRPETAAKPPAAPDADIQSAPLFTRAAFAIAYGAQAPAGFADDSALNDTIFSDYEGDRCASNGAGGADFAAAVEADTALAAEERKALTEARAALKPTCQTGGPAAPAVAVASPRGREYAAYLAGAAAFYGADYDAALASFGGLGKSGNGWLAEASRYMVARAALNKAQIGAFAAFDTAPAPKISDRESLAAAEKAFQAYLADFPTGRYAASARGLLRRVYWLGGDKDKLSAEYAWQIAHAGERQADLDPASLAQEIDSKLLDAQLTATHDPILLAAGDLMRMRKPATLSADQLKAQAPDFASQPELYAYLEAARAFYVDGDAAAALDRLGPPSARFAFSRETLRGEALTAAGRYGDATAHWRAMLASASRPWEKEAVELGLAINFERAGTLNKAFEGETRLASPRLRALLLRHAAGPILLREAIANPQSTDKERSLARFVLLYKEATRGQYKNFLRDFTPEARKDELAFAAYYKPSVFAWPGGKESYVCPALTATITQLAADPAKAHARLCLAEFLRESGLDGFDALHPAANELGGGKSIFPGEPYVLAEVYTAVLADASAPRDDRAYALYRLVNCYASSGYNHCGGKDAEPAQRKAWFQLLKSKYSDTPWAKAQRYYW